MVLLCEKKDSLQSDVNNLREGQRDMSTYFYDILHQSANEEVNQQYVRMSATL